MPAGIWWAGSAVVRVGVRVGGLCDGGSGGGGAGGGGRIGGEGESEVKLDGELLGKRIPDGCRRACAVKGVFSDGKESSSARAREQRERTRKPDRPATRPQDGASIHFWQLDPVPPFEPSRKRPHRPMEPLGARRLPRAQRGIRLALEVGAHGGRDEWRLGVFEERQLAGVEQVNNFGQEEGDTRCAEAEEDEREGREGRERPPLLAV